jgi:hypothetical protein
LGTVGQYPVANRVPLQGAAGCGGRIRFSPKGAAAYGTPRNAVTPPEVRPSSAPPEGGPATRGPRTDKHGRPRLTVLYARAALPASVVLALMQEGFGLWWPATGRRAIVAPLAVLLLPAAVLITAGLSAIIATQRTPTTASGSQAPAP